MINNLVKRTIQLFKTHGLGLLVILIASLFISTSPLHAYSRWSNIMAMLSMGHGMLAGSVPFVNAFEQRGPIIYAIYALAWLIWPEQPLYGVYVIELINLVGLYGILYHLAKHDFKSRSASAAASSGILLLLFVRAFNYGGSPEELLLIPLSYPFVWLLESIRNQNSHKRWTTKQWLLIGVFAGIIFWSKYILIGYIAFPALCKLIQLVFVKDRHIHFKKLRNVGLACKAIGLALGGFFIATLPVMTYYGFNHAIPDLIKGYFLENAGYAGSFSVMTLVFAIAACAISLSYCFGFLIPLGYVSTYFGITYTHRDYNSFSLKFSMIMATVLVFISARPGVSYGLPFFFWVIILATASLSSFFKELIKYKNMQIFFVGLITLSFIILPMLSLVLPKMVNSQSFYDFDLDRHALGLSPQSLKKDPIYLIGKKIKKDPGNMMVYNALDQGYFYWAGQYPKIYSWEETAAEYNFDKKSINQQYDYIAKKKVKYIVMYNGVPISKSTDSKPISKSTNSRADVYKNEYELYRNKKVGTIGVLPKILIKNYRLISVYKQKINFDGTNMLETHYLWKEK